MIEIKGKDIVWSYLGALLSMAANIVMIPFLVYYLDENLLGLWYVFCSIGAMTALFDFGFATTLLVILRIALVERKSFAKKI